MNLTRLRLVIALCILIPVLSIAQGVLEGFEPDIDLLKQDIEYLQERENYQAIDIESESSAELFPQRRDEDLVEGIRSAAQEEGVYVTVRVNGVPVALEDVQSSSWFAPYVRDMAERGIISGYRDSEGQPLGVYGPGDNVTVEQLAKIAMESSHVPITECQGTLKNKSAKGNWSQEYILCAEDLGWALFSDGSVNVGRAASRSEVVVTMLQAFDAELRDATGTVFNDVTRVTEFAVAIETAARQGIVSGYSDERGNPTGMFGPLNPVNRAEVAKIASLVLHVYGSN